MRSTRPLSRRLKAAGIAIAPYVVFFILIMVITLPEGLDSKVGSAHLGLFTWSADAAKSMGQSDSGSLLNAAISIKGSGKLLSDVFWVFHFWPPGMVVLDIVLLYLESAFLIPITFLMVIVNSALWAVFLGVAFRVIDKRFGTLPAVIVTSGMLLSSAVTSWGTGWGLFYSDSYGAVAYCFSILFLILIPTVSDRWQRIRYASYAGVLLAVASYFRATYELIATAAVVCAAVLIVLLLIFRWLRRLKRLTAISLPAVVSIGLAALVAQVLMTPWRLIAGLKIHPGDFRWSTVSDLASGARWIPDQLLAANPTAGFAKAGHSNWACMDDPAQCEQIFSQEGSGTLAYTGSGHFTGAEFDQMTLKSFLSHPWAFLSERINAISFGFLSNTGASVKVYAMPESLLLLVLFISLIVVLMKTHQLMNAGYLLYFSATLLQLATISLLHMESRYFLGIELSTMLVGGYALAEYFHSRKRPHQQIPLGTTSGSS